MIGTISDSYDHQKVRISIATFQETIALSTDRQGKLHSGGETLTPPDLQGVGVLNVPSRNTIYISRMVAVIRLASTGIVQ